MIVLMMACVLIRSGHSFRYPSTVLKHWKPRPSYVAPSQPEILVPEDDDEEVEEELVLNPDELKNIKRRILWSLKKLGRKSFYGEESNQGRPPQESEKGAVRCGRRASSHYVVSVF